MGLELVFQWRSVNLFLCNILGPTIIMNKAEYEASRRIKAGGRPEITEESPYFKVPKVVPRPPMPTSNPLDAAAHGEPAQERERPDPDRSSSGSGSASVGVSTAMRLSFN